MGRKRIRKSAKKTKSNVKEVIDKTRKNTNLNSKYKSVEIEFYKDSRESGTMNDVLTSPSSISTGLESSESEMTSSPSSSPSESIEVVSLKEENLNHEGFYETQQQVSILFNRKLLVNKFQKTRAPAELKKTDQFKHNSSKSILKQTRSKDSTEDEANGKIQIIRVRKKFWS